MQNNYKERHKREHTATVGWKKQTDPPQRDKEARYDYSTKTPASFVVVSSFVVVVCLLHPPGSLPLCRSRGNLLSIFLFTSFHIGELKNPIVVIHLLPRVNNLAVNNC